MSDRRTVYFTAPHRVEVRSESLPDHSSEDIYIDSELIGISHGTEMLLYRGELPTNMQVDEELVSLGGSFDYPVVYGYSNVGRSNNGDLYFGFVPHQSGFWADPATLVKVPNGVTAADALFIPNLETALGIVHDLAPLTGEIVAVIGGGVVGQLVLEILVRGFYGKLLLIEPNPERQALATHLGVPAVAPDGPEVGQWVASATDGRGVDRVVEVSGNPAAVQQALDLLGFSGVLVEASWFGAKMVELQLGGTFHRGRIEIRSSQVSNISPGISGRWSKERRMGAVLELLREIHPGRLISHRFAIDDAGAAFALIDSGQSDVFQVVLESKRGG